jgi:hypothetical protein
MESTRLGLNFKLPIPKTNGLSLVSSGMVTVAGRNMGKAMMVTGGFVYQAAFTKKEN